MRRIVPQSTGAVVSDILCIRVTPTQRKGLQQIADEDGATESEVTRRLLAAEIRKRRPNGRR